MICVSLSFIERESGHIMTLQEAAADEDESCRTRRRIFQHDARSGGYTN